jgi:hypothetical protein
MSPWGSDCLIVTGFGDASRTVSEDPGLTGFLLIVRTERVVTAHV